MPFACLHIRNDLLTDFSTACLVVQKSDMLFPRQPDHHVETAFCSCVEHPDGRYGVCTDRIEPGFCDLTQIVFDAPEIVELGAGLVRAERPVGYSFDPELFFAVIQEFTAAHDTSALPSLLRSGLRRDRS